MKLLFWCYVIASCWSLVLNQEDGDEGANKDVEEGRSWRYTRSVSTSKQLENPSNPSKASKEGCECVHWEKCNDAPQIGLRFSDADDTCGDDTHIICCAKSKLKVEPTNAIPVSLSSRQKCGVRHPGGTSAFRAAANDESAAGFGEFPWMVMVLVEDGDNFSYKCGGSLIHPKVVLTAGHCVNNLDKKYKIRVGEWDALNEDETFEHQDMDVATLIRHPRYRSEGSGGYLDDISLLILDSPVEIKEHVDVVCLPDVAQLVDFENCFASGWDGKHQENNQYDILKRVELPIVPRDVCQGNLRKPQWLGPKFKLHKSFICAGGEAGQGLCKDATGSPLVCPIPDSKPKRYYQAGVAGWGFSCGEENVPGVYVNVSLFMDWIREELSKHDINLETSYTETTKNPLETISIPFEAPIEEDCDCVDYLQCKGATKSDLRSGDLCSENFNIYQMCCPKSRIIGDSGYSVSVSPSTPSPLKCGVRNPEGIGIHAGPSNKQSAEFGEFPWVVIVLRKEEGEDEVFTHKYGGSLIHPRVVLTAAHGVYRNSYKYKIRAGEWDTTHTNELLKFQDRDVETVIFHPDFYPGAGFNDIALLILGSPVDIAKNVATICLPQQNQPIAVHECVATGWGRDTPEGADRSVLKKVNLPIVPREACQTALRKALRPKFNLHESLICAGGKAGQDTCKGDGGGPLTCQIPGNPDRYYQAGIVAWGISCGNANVPGVYVNVPLFVDWINQELIPYNIDSSYYTI